MNYKKTLNYEKKTHNYRRDYNFNIIKDCWGWLQCKSHIANEGKKSQEIIFEKSHIL
jgi:hypothetical protein